MTHNPLTTIQAEARAALLEHPAVKAADNAIILQAVRMGGSGYEGPKLPDWLDTQLSLAHAAGKAEGREETIVLVKKYWMFDENQQHTHSWHDRADFLEEAARLFHTEEKN